MPTRTDRQRLTLPHYPPITVAVTTNGETATYRVRGRRLAGALEVTPCFDHATEALPSLVRVHLGVTGPSWTPDQRREELPTVHGVALCGPHVINPVRHILTPRPWLNPSRAGGGEPSEPTRRYYTETITAIMIHYVARPDARAEQRHHARRTAPARLANLNSEILTAARRLADARAELDRLQAAALALAHLDAGQ